MDNMSSTNSGSSDPIEGLAVGLAADHQAEKRKRAAKPKPEADADLAGEGPAQGEPQPDRADLDGGLNTDAMEAAAEQAELIAGSLVGDIRDAMMEAFKHRPKPWSQMLAGEQADVAKAMEYAAKVVVNKAVLALAAEDRPSIQAVFKGYADKAGELTGTVKFLNVQDADVLALHRASGKTILLVVADSQAFSGQRRAPQVDADEAELDFEAGGGEEDESE
jgi:hypothetical protein